MLKQEDALSPPGGEDQHKSNEAVALLQSLSINLAMDWARSFGAALWGPLCPSDFRRATVLLAKQLLERAGTNFDPQLRTEAAKANSIREQNDTFRKSLDSILGNFTMTAGVSALPSDVRAMALRKVSTFDAWSADNDPHGEHDFGSFELAGHRFFFKIDYYRPSLDVGSDDPADPARTRRVLTLMLTEEY